MFLQVRNLTKKYDNVTPLMNVSCYVNKGDVVAIIGPSGTGKTTFINCINRIDEPTSGEIYYNGECITDKKYDLSKLRTHIGMVFQSYNLFNHLTIIENAMLAQVEIKHKSKQEAYDKAMRALDFLDLEDKAYSYPAELSGGQKQRAAIVRTACMEPEIILFDEPTAALDPSSIKDVEKAIHKLKSKGITMLIVTHELNFAKNISSRVFYMDEANIYEEGETKSFFENPKKVNTIEFLKNKL